MFIGETWIDTKLSFKKCWLNSHIIGVITNTSSLNCLIVVAAETEDDFFGKFVTCFQERTSDKTGDYHGQMINAGFENWVWQKLLPNLQNVSVIIMDNVPHHSVQVNKQPSKYTIKVGISAGLNTNMQKAELKMLVSVFKKPEKVFHTNELIRSDVFSVIRLPTYHCDLNGTELA